MSKALRSIAIAGAWGYIGRKLLDAAVARQMKVYAFDPGPRPSDLTSRYIERIEDEAAFYQLKPDFFHLAVHPEHRSFGLSELLRRSQTEQIVMLVEKPLAIPESPQLCHEIVDAAARSKAMVFYDFPELFDPLTEIIWDYLEKLPDVEISEIYVQRSKDREDPAKPRNYKKMVSIEYQETVHCMAFVLGLLGKVTRNWKKVLEQGVSVTAESQPYKPPNPQDYEHTVDGRCEYTGQIGETQICGLTDFKSGAENSKRRIVHGTTDGQSFKIDAEYFEGEKQLFINNRKVDFNPQSSSYEGILQGVLSWCDDFQPIEIRDGIHPNPRLAHLTYQLSSMLWESSHTRAPATAANYDDLLAFRTSTVAH
jgi:predicted dehydrogenase